MLRNQTLTEWTNLKTKFNQLKANALTSQEKAWLTSLVTALHHFWKRDNDSLTNSGLVGLNKLINPQAISADFNTRLRGMRKNWKKIINFGLNFPIKLLK